MPTRKSSKGREKRLQDRAALQLFLETHGFAGVNAPRKPKRRLIPRPSCLFAQEEVLYPVHVAAQQADVQVLKLLLRSGAKKDQRTSKGRTPFGIGLYSCGLGKPSEGHADLEGNNDACSFDWYQCAFLWFVLHIVIFCSVPWELRLDRCLRCFAAH